MKRVRKIISLCLQYRKYIMSVLDKNNSSEIQKKQNKKMKGFTVIAFGGQLQQTNNHHPFWKVKVGFNLQIKNVFGSLKKYKL